MLLFFFRLSFFSSLAYLLQSSSCSICVYIYHMYHTFSEPQYGGPCTQGKSLTRTVTSGSEKDQFYVRWRPIQHRLNRCLYIYIRLSGPKKKEIKIMLSPIFQVTLKKHAHVQVPIYLQIKCRCN